MGELERVVADLVDAYLSWVRTHEPVAWTRIGGRGRDTDLPDRAAAGLDARRRDLSTLHRRVQRVREVADHDDAGDGSREPRDDLVLLDDELAARRFVLDERRREATDPLAALDTVTAGVHELLFRTGLSPQEERVRVAAALARARAVPSFLAAAAGQLESVAAPHLAVARGRLAAIERLLTEVLPARAVAHGLDVDDVDTWAAEGLAAFAVRLDELADATPGPWRYGPSDHAVALHAAVGTGPAAAEIDVRARAWREVVTAELDELACAGWRRRFPGVERPTGRHERVRRTLAAVGDTALPRDRLLAEARAAIAEARAFAITLGLGDVPPAQRLRIAEVPDHLAGVAVAFITPPPALDPRGGCTYHLSPVPDRWDRQRARSYLREYNPAQLRSLALHEGYPGHAVQLEHAAAHPRPLRRLLARTGFAEGWAVHVEREAAAAGFGSDGSSTVDGDDYLLTQRKLELRIATNALLDVGLHSGDLDDRAALQLLTDGAFQEPAEADGKLTRAKVTAGQLSSYFVGGAQLADLRAEVADREGAAFDPRRFHQALLSHGTPTVAILRRALADPTSQVRRPFG